MKFTKQTLSVLAIAAFFLMAVASKVNKIHGNAFSSETKPEKKEEANYVVLNDGTRVTGKKIIIKNGLFSKSLIRIDDQDFKFGEVDGYMQNGTYQKKKGNGFMVRLVHGKINIYRDSYTSTNTSTDRNGRMSTSSNIHYIHYAQRGENGPMFTIANQKDIKEAVSDCPLAVELASLSNGKMRRAIRSNRRYLNEIFEIYNNDCKPLR